MRNRGLHRILLFLLGTAALAALAPSRRRGAPRAPGTGLLWSDADPAADDASDRWEYPRGAAPTLGRTRRLTTLAYVVLFVLGASFSATAGGKVGDVLDPSGGTDAAEVAAAPEAAPSVAATSVAAPSDAAPVAAPAPDSVATDPAPAPEVSPAAAPEAAAPAAQAEPESDQQVDEAAPRGAWAPPAAVAAPAPAPASVAPAPRAPTAARRATSRPAPTSPPVPAPTRDPSPPEDAAPGTTGVVWLDVPLPDPTPAAARLAPTEARALVSAAEAHHVGWALLLGVMRAAERHDARQVASELAAAPQSPWASALRVLGSTDDADRAVALARYNRAVGLWALVHGLEAARPSLERRLLRDPKVAIYPGGRDDVAAGRVDVRVLAVIEYLRVAFGSVEVSSLFSGHRLYARPGVVSAHIFGHAVDVAALGGVPVAGHQEPGGLTERAVKDLLLLPSELQPRQVISLLGLGGPSFGLADHADHVHVGF